MSIRKIINETRQFVRRQLPLSELPQHVFIVGAQKAGTTSLYSYLVKHPMVIGGDEKELGFFISDKLFNARMSYRSLFPIRINGTHALDATPEYMYYRKCAERIHAFSSDSKIVIVLREPVSRAYSAFNMYQQICRQKWFRDKLHDVNAVTKSFYMPLADGRIRPDIHYFLDREMAIIKGEAEGEEPALIRRGIYAPQLDRFIRLFGQGNVLVLFSDDLKREPAKITNEVLQFVGLEPLSGIEYPLKHVREYTADNQAIEAIRQHAGVMFEKDKQKLVNNYGLKVPW